jgi:hypothetical protein
VTLQMTGKVVVAGTPTEGAYIRINGPSGDFVWEARTDADGEYKFNIPEGTWTVVAFAPGTEKSTQQYTLTPESDPLDIDLRPE